MKNIFFTKETKCNCRKISQVTTVGKDLERCIEKILYGNKTAFLLHKSGALGRNEINFPGSEIGKLRYVDIDMSRRVNTKNIC